MKYGQQICQCCKKVYDINDKEADVDTCSFECWEKINCLTPPKVQFEKLEIADLN